MNDKNTKVVGEKVAEEGKENQEIILINEETIQSKIYMVRGQKVMLDFELAEIYGYTTKRFNEQVKNNIERFDEDFRFQLLKEKFDNLRSKKIDLKLGWNKIFTICFYRAGSLYADDGFKRRACS